MADVKDEYTLMRYSCGWCGYEFKQFVRRIEFESKSVSSQVVCTFCKNGLKTWDGEEIQVYKTTGKLTKRVFEINESVT